MITKQYLDSDIFVYENSISDSDWIVETIENDLCVNYRDSWEFCSNKNLMHNPFFKNKLFYRIGMEYKVAGEEVLNVVFPQSEIDQQNLRQNIKTSVDRQVTPYIFDFIKETNTKIMSRDQWCVIKNDKNVLSDFFIDQNNNNPTKISCVISLNDNYEGGEFLFEDRIGNNKYKLAKASMMIYPSLYPHKIMPITSGEQYLLVSFGLDLKN